MSILSSFRRLRRPPQAGTPSQNFDVFHPKTMASIIDSRGRPFGEWSAADADSAESCARFVLGLLRDSPKLRGHFPDATSPEGGYSEWLRVKGAREFQLSFSAIENIDAVFAQDLGEPVHESYLHNPELQDQYPLALLPVGQKRFVKWLLGKGGKRHSFSDEQILWFLHQSAERIAAGVVETYLLRPEWQDQFPFALANSGQRDFLRWLRNSFPKFALFQRLKSLPKVLSADEETALRGTLSRESNNHFGNQRSAPALGVNLLAHFCYPSGLQRAALAAKAGLESAAVPISARDVPSGVKTELEPRNNWLGLEIYPFTIINVAPFPLFPVSYRRAGLARRDNVFRIACWYWELDQILPDWTSLAPLIDEIWAPTPFIAQAMRTMPIPVHNMLPGILPAKTERIARETLGIPANHFVFLFLFDMCSDFERKNPLALIRAFRRAFSPDEPVTLLIKLARGSAHPPNLARLHAAAREHGVVIVDQVVSLEKANGFIEMCDCFVSLHRSEGFGLGLAEAMFMGKPVIGTNYSGNLAFMTPQNSFLVDYELVEIAGEHPVYKKGFRWANPSETHAAALMREVYEDRDAAIGRARQAQAEIAERLSVQAAGRRMTTRLREIRDER